jgi:hypothetical protein
MIAQLDKHRSAIARDVRLPKYRPRIMSDFGLVDAFVNPVFLIFKKFTVVGPRDGV